MACFAGLQPHSSYLHTATLPHSARASSLQATTVSLATDDYYLILSFLTSRYYYICQYIHVSSSSPAFTLTSRSRWTTSVRISVSAHPAAVQLSTSIVPFSLMYSRGKYSCLQFIRHTTLSHNLGSLRSKLIQEAVCICVPLLSNGPSFRAVTSQLLRYCGIDFHFLPTRATCPTSFKHNKG